MNDIPPEAPDWIHEADAEFEDMLARIDRGECIASPELQALVAKQIDEELKNPRPVEDTSTWARRLAEDLSKFTD
jgi:hypothetical protein